MSYKTGQAPTGCCGQYVPQAFQEKKYFPQIYFSFTCVSQFSLKQQFPFQLRLKR